MFNSTAGLYDLFYTSMKDYSVEAGQLNALLKQQHPDARTILDAACGTGEHARYLTHEHGFAVDGFDLQPEFVEIAAAKNPAGEFRRADLRDFHFEQQYDAVLCLFGSIGYLLELDAVREALLCMRKHLEEGGVIVLEPWLTPENARDEYRDSRTVEGDGIRMTRNSHSVVRGRESHIQFEYLIETPDGERRTKEDHVLGLYTVDEMLDCFAQAGLQAEHEDEGLMGRGLYVAKPLASL